MKTSNDSKSANAGNRQPLGSETMLLATADQNRSIEGNLNQEPADVSYRDIHKDLKADFMLANPPFNMRDWGSDRLSDHLRWKFSAPPLGGSNLARVQYFLHHLAPSGVAAFALTNGSFFSNQSGQDVSKA